MDKGKLELNPIKKLAYIDRIYGFSFLFILSPLITWYSQRSVVWKYQNNSPVHSTEEW